VEREAFFARLRARRAGSGGGAAAAERTAASERARPAPERTAPEPADLTALFVERLAELGATAEVVATRQDAREALERLAGVRGWAIVAAAPALTWPSAAVRWTTEAREAQLGLCEGDWAVAETGAVVVCSSFEVRRGYSLVPPAAAFFVPGARMVAGLGDVLRVLPAEGPELPSAVSFVSGPSGTSDIAGTHVVGVHGPGKVFVWVIAEE
jgi:L-lactate dehydrogenase complex protein LldG